MLTRRRLITTLPGAAALLYLRPGRASAAASFQHGVASGDPGATGVLLWTRVTPRFPGIVEVDWTVARDPDFEAVVQRGTAATDAGRDYTLKVAVDGLEPGASYYYRFSARGAISPVGRTRTLPEGRVDRIVLAACSCSNYPAGYFNAYRAMANLDEIDFVLHLGDYLYEYDKAGYASQNSRALHRVSFPGHELVSLQDYRARHAQYKSDPDLQAVHAAHPFIVTWDDHESANDAWTDGAQNHDPSEGDWAARRSAAIQAYYEWMPIREPGADSNLAAWRAFELGDLASLIMLETRLSARTRQADPLAEMVYREVPFDFSDPAHPVAVTAQQAAALDPTVLRRIPVPFDLRADPPQPVTDYARLQTLDRENLPEDLAYLPDARRFREEVLAAPGRRKLSDRQRTFVQETLFASTRAGKPWQVLGNQTLMAQVSAPNLADGLSADEVARLPDYIRPYVGYTRLGLPLSPDAWDGYDAERRWLCDALRAAEASPVVLSGDSHAAWALDVMHPGSGARAAVEFGTTSISSPGFTETLGIEGERIAAMLAAANDNLQFSDTRHRGFLTLELTRAGAEARYHIVDTVAQRDYQTGIAHTVRLRHRRGSVADWA